MRKYSISFQRETLSEQIRIVFELRRTALALHVHSSASDLSRKPLAPPKVVVPANIPVSIVLFGAPVNPTHLARIAMRCGGNLRFSWNIAMIFVGGLPS